MRMSLILILILVWGEGSQSAAPVRFAVGLVASAAAQIETICCASTSSGLRGTTVVSIRPSRMRLATTAHSRRSARNFGKMRPRLTSPTLCPARPIRCRPRATDFGDSTWITRSTAPMSMPSSSDEVATRHGSSPALSSSSTTVRSSSASEPWWARAISRTGRSGWAGSESSAADSSLSRSASRSALRRALTKMIVELCSRTSASSSGYIAGQIELSVGSVPPASGSSGTPGVSPGAAIDSTGTWIRRSSGLRTPASTIRHCRRGPTRKRPTSSSGFCVALRPIRCSSRSAPPRDATSVSRSSVSARCAPRLLEATAWISSTMHQRVCSNNRCA